MDPITSIFFIKMIEAALGRFIFASVVMLTILYFDSIISWFRSKSYLKQSDVNNIAFSLNDKTDGKYSTVYGIYNTKNETVLEAQKVNSNDIDDQIKLMHKGSKLAVYE